VVYCNFDICVTVVLLMLFCSYCFVVIDLYIDAVVDIFYDITAAALFAVESYCLSVSVTAGVVVNAVLSLLLCW